MNPSATCSRWPLALIAFSGLLVAALFGRLWVLQQLSEAALGCRACVVPGVLRSDLPLLALAGALFALSFMLGHRLWSILWRILAIVLWLVYLADVAVTAQFATRLSLADIRIYLAQPEVVWQHLGSIGKGQWLLALSGLGVIMMLLIPQAHRTMSRLVVMSMPLIWGAVGVLGWFIPYPGYVHDWAVRNVLAANLPNGISSPYSSASIEKARHAVLPFTCGPGLGARENIVILIVESWSPYHSAYWGGLNDWTPRLDALARRGQAFKRFHAGGYNTNEGLIALLTGMSLVLPITPPSQARAFETAWDRPHTLPKQLRVAGYHTHFITSGDLGFTRKGEWLLDIGFDRVEGHDHPDYDGVPRLHFSAVADDILYARARRLIAELHEGEKEFLAVVESVSSHHPFVHPYTGQRDEEAVMRYVDAAAADFIEALENDDFFDNGVLVVVSDHRAMTFVSRAEVQQFGRAAASRIPAFILAGNRGNDKLVPEAGYEIHTLLHQADLPRTLLNRVSDEVCATANHRDMLAHSDDSSRCIFHARGDHRDRIDVLCGHADGTVEVAGDDTRFVEHAGLSGAERQEMMNRIAAQRLQAAGFINLLR